MSLLGWAGEHWFDLIQSVGIAVGLVYTGRALRADIKARRVTNHFSLTRQHREIWSLLFWRPELARILEPNVDLQKAPVTPQEELFVHFLIFHLNDSHRAKSDDFFVFPENLAADIRQFFSLPIPQAVWKKARAVQDRNFVAFVEGAIATPQPAAA